MEAPVRRLIRFSFLGAVLGCLTTLVSPAAQAQTLSGFQVNRYEPTAAGEWSFAVDHPWYSSTRRLAAGLTLDYAHHPLMLGVTNAGGFSETRPLVGDLFIGHFDFAVSFLDRILVTASLPLTFADSGDLAAGATVGDPRLGIMGRVYGQPFSSVFSVSVGAQLWIPLRAMTSAISATASDQQVRVLPKVILGGVWRWLMWSATAGFLYRQDAAVANLPVTVAADSAGHVGSELQFGIAASYFDAQRRFSVGPEIVLATTATGPSAFSRFGTSLETLVGAQYNIARLVQVGGALGLGFVREPGTPDFRMLIRIAYAPFRKAEKDTDGDGIPDSEDACIREKGVRTGSAMNNGCPPSTLERDRDGDGVTDLHDICPDVPRGATPDPDRRGCPLSAKPAEVPTDKDGDGVLDKEDACPDVPKGPQPDPNRAGCPSQDSDKDGVIDPLDQCLFEPAGLTPDPARPGCPLADRDGDGVPDPQDACPDKPGAPSPYPKRNGCPGLIEVKNGQIVILKPVFFATAKDTILPKSYAVLQAVADGMQAMTSIKRVAIEGHTDAQGKFDANIDLSDRRAKSVMKWLVAKGVEIGRLEARGYGPTRPIASNKSAAGKAKNRRVEFHIIDVPAASQAPTEKAN